MLLWLLKDHISKSLKLTCLAFNIFWGRFTSSVQVQNVQALTLSDNAWKNWKWQTTNMAWLTWNVKQPYYCNSTVLLISAPSVWTSRKKSHTLKHRILGPTKWHNTPRDNQNKHFSEHKRPLNSTSMKDSKEKRNHCCQLHKLDIEQAHKWNVAKFLYVYAQKKKTWFLHKVIVPASVAILDQKAIKVKTR